MVDAAPGTGTPPVATPPAGGSGTPPVVTPPAGGAGAPADWTAGLTDELKGYVGNKGWKSPVDAIDSYRNAEKLIGAPQDKVMKLPDRFYDDQGALTPEGRGIFEKLGAPKDSKDYGFKAGEGQDQGRIDAFGKWAQEAGLSKPQAEKILSQFQAQEKTQMDSMRETIKANHAQQETKLKGEWGQAMEQNTNIAQQAAQKLGMTADQVSAIANQLGHAETMKMFHKFGSSMGEAGFVGGNPSNSTLAPITAKAKIAELRSDKGFGDRLLAGDGEAKATWQRLHEQAYPGSASL